MYKKKSGKCAICENCGEKKNEEKRCRASCRRERNENYPTSFISSASDLLPASLSLDCVRFVRHSFDEKCLYRLEWKRASDMEKET